jgi:hypothetical protein
MAFNAPNPDVAPEDLRTGRSPAQVTSADLESLDPADRAIPEVSDRELDPLDPNPRQ